MYALVDCNNFFASCERVFQPQYNDIPVVVLSNNDGCVIARSDEAKQFVPMGAPTHKYEKIFKQNKVKVFSANFPLYGDMSNRVMGLLKQYCPNVEVYSIDEAFIDYKGFKQDLQEFNQTLRYKLLKETGLPTCIGVAQTKTLAKVANTVAKKFKQRTGGVYIIDSEEKRIKALKWLKVGDVWGIGYKHAKRLKDKGIHTAYEFTQLSDAWIRKHMKVFGLRTKQELLGKEIYNLRLRAPKKSIATTRSFEEMYTDYNQVRERITTFAVSCAEKLRKQNSTCGALYVFLRTNRFRHDLKQYRNGQFIWLDNASNSSIDLVKAATKALDLIFKEGYHYKKAGVIATSLQADTTHQLSLFTTKNYRHKKIMQSIDHINYNIKSYGVKLASQYLNKTWRMKQERLSRRYSTKLDEVIVIKAH